ncbi:putative endoglucanase [Xanthomonas phage Xp15]|uniref:Putative endoglucanase n=1 Tax=Xanthomonas phage Xp15 TaxID=322855 RepID=Q52PU1_9CAUD|nr:putative endoglucanase [Xanthomonas phage Xp15]AAX84906.1 putative endoglucanase [Xanthomonas phage Xp15]
MRGKAAKCAHPGCPHFATKGHKWCINHAPIRPKPAPVPEPAPWDPSIGFYVHSPSSEEIIAYREETGCGQMEAKAILRRKALLEAADRAVVWGDLKLIVKMLINLDS